MSPCTTCGRPLSAAESSCPRCTDPEATRTAAGRRGADTPPYAPGAAHPPPPPQPWGAEPPPYPAPQAYGAQYGAPQYGAPQQPGRPLPSPRGPSGRGRLLAYVGGGAAMLLVVGLGAWAVTGLGSDDDRPAAEPTTSQSASSTGSEGSAESPAPSRPLSTPPSTEEAAEPDPSAPEDGAGDGDGDNSATYDLSEGSQTVDLTIVVDEPTTVTVTPDTPEDVVLTVLGPRGAEACRSDSSFTDPESCTLRSPQVGGVYEVVVSMYGDVPGGTGVIETS